MANEMTEKLDAFLRWMEEQPVEEIPIPPMPKLTRQTNQCGPRSADLDNGHEHCDIAPCASCTNGVLIELEFIRDGSIKMVDSVKARRIAHLEKLLEASAFYFP